MDFTQAVTRLLLWEGGLVNDHDDPGKITNYGISLRWYREVVSPEATEDDIKGISKDRAIELYKEYFWDNQLYNKLITQDVANYVFDMAVNMGPAVAHKITQRATWSISENMELVDDGIFGANTISTLNYLGHLVLPPVRAERASHYRVRVATEPDSKKYFQGWLNRTYLDKP